MATLYFSIIFLIFTTIFSIISIFLHGFNLFLYTDTIFILIIGIYGPLIILPSIRTKTGKIKIWIYEMIVISLIVIVFLFIIFDLFYLIWNIISSLLVILLMTEDFHGLTPIYKSELGEKTWKKGKDKMKFLFGEYNLQPYGQIDIEREKCIGCKICIEICPRNLYVFNTTDNKVNLINKEKCINCNACVKRCPANCLKIS